MSMPEFTPRMSSSRATLIGFMAILMWSLLSLLTVASGARAAVPARRDDVCRSAARSVPRPGSSRARRVAARCSSPGRSGRSASADCSAITRCSFSRCGSRRRPRRNSSTTLWPLLIVLFSALLPGERLKCASRRGRADRARRHGGAVRRARRHQLRAGLSAGLCGGVRRGVHLGDLFGAVAPLRRGADRYGRGLLPRDRGARGALPSAVRADPLAADRGAVARGRRRSASGRSALRSMPGTSA